MATITISPLTPVRMTPKRRGLLLRVLDAIVESRTREAERIVSDHLMTLDDATLERQGLDRAALRRKASGAYL